MAGTKFTKSTKADGRDLAVKLLQRIERLNDGYLQDARKSRDVLLAALEKFSALPTSRERRRFAAILNNSIGSAFAGFQIMPADYAKGPIESIYQRISTRVLNENRAARTGVRHG